MIQNDDQLNLVKQQSERAEAALLSLRRDALPKSVPRYNLESPSVRRLSDRIAIWISLCEYELLSLLAAQSVVRLALSNKLEGTNCAGRSPPRNDAQRPLA